MWQTKQNKLPCFINRWCGGGGGAGGGGGKNHGSCMLFKMSMQLLYMYNKSIIGSN
jgi:hypothetical protein